MPQCQILCEHCQRPFPSPIQFGDAEAFFTCTLVGNAVRCPYPDCRHVGGCNKENMRFVTDDQREGFVGDKTV